MASLTHTKNRPIMCLVLKSCPLKLISFPTVMFVKRDFVFLMLVIYRLFRFVGLVAIHITLRERCNLVITP